MSARQTKPTAYIAPYITGHFMLEPVREWLGKNYWGNTVAWGKTRRECEQECRRAGYIPVRDK